MVRPGRPGNRRVPRSPHVRGDGPSSLPVLISEVAFSPRAWGWSEAHRMNKNLGNVLPTCVGMVRAVNLLGRCAGRSPHVRGDGPYRVPYWLHLNRFSPRAWGWSGPVLEESMARKVLPTCVGMVRTRAVADRIRCRSPHVRGDGPQHVDALAARPRS